MLKVFAQSSMSKVKTRAKGLAEAYKGNVYYRKGGAKGKNYKLANYKKGKK